MKPPDPSAAEKGPQGIEVLFVFYGVPHKKSIQGMPGGPAVMIQSSLFRKEVFKAS